MNSLSVHLFRPQGGTPQAAKLPELVPPRMERIRPAIAHLLKPGNILLGHLTSQGTYEEIKEEGLHAVRKEMSRTMLEVARVESSGAVVHDDLAPFFENWPFKKCAWMDTLVLVVVPGCETGRLENNEIFEAVPLAEQKFSSGLEGASYTALPWRIPARYVAGRIDIHTLSFTPNPDYRAV